MFADARTFTLEDTFLEPQVLAPPPTRHALFIFLLALAAVLHLATAGWTDLYDGVEGQFAGGAREMLATHQWLLPTNDGVPRLQTPPLAFWLILLSYKIFGVTAMAARLPIAMAMIASIALTFLIGERLAGYWRGFAAGLIHLCFGGAFLLGRAVTPEPVFSAFIAGAIFCAICGYQRRRFRRGWFAGFWFCASLACLSNGLEGLCYLAGICILLAIFFREARLRFRFLLHWSYLLLFLVLVVPWYLWAQKHFPGFFPRLFSWPEVGLPRWQFLVLHFVWWFPVSILVLPGLFFAPRRIFRPQEITFAEALPLCWMAVGFLPLLLLGDQSLYFSMSMWSAVALWAAMVWERTPRPLQVAGICCLLVVGAAIGAIAFFTPEIPGGIAPENISVVTWLALRRMLEIAGLALGFSAVLAFYFSIRQRPEIALLLVLAAMVPIGLGLAEAASRVAPSFSLAGAARLLNSRLGERGQVLFEGPLHDGSTLTFYLNRRFFLVNQAPDFFDRDATARQKYLDEPFVLEAWNRSDPIYLIIDESRIPRWRGLLTTRVHIYHQVTTCGHYVVLSNQL